MDTNLPQLEEKLYGILIEINVKLRGQTIIMHDHFKTIPRILNDINLLIKDHLVSRKLIKYLMYTYDHMISQFDYARYDSTPKEKRSEVREAIISFETCIISFLQNNSPELLELKNEYSDRLEEYINNYSINKDKVIKLLESILANIADEKNISRKLAYYLFLLQREFLWNTKYLKEPIVTWDELKSDEDFNKYLDISKYVYDIYGQNIRM